MIFAVIVFILLAPAEKPALDGDVRRKIFQQQLQLIQLKQNAIHHHAKKRRAGLERRAGHERRNAGEVQ